jgi:hypothetical protein
MNEKNLLSQFMEVVEHSESIFIAHIDEYTYINIRYVNRDEIFIPWNPECEDSYRIQVWQDDECNYDEVKIYPTMEEAILHAVEWISLDYDSLILS